MALFGVFPASAECPIKQDLDVLRYMDVSELLAEHAAALETTLSFAKQCTMSGFAGHKAGCNEVAFCERYTDLTQRVARKEHSLSFISYSEWMDQRSETRAAKAASKQLSKTLAKLEKKYEKAKKSADKKSSEKNLAKLEKAKISWQEAEQEILELQQKISSMDSRKLVKN